MFTPLHRVLGLSPGPFDWALLQQAVADGVREQADLDWKQSLYNTKSPTWRDEAAKDITAMANSGGGWIVFGVSEHDEQAAELIPLPWGPAEEQRLRQVALSRATPAVVGIEFHVVNTPDSEDCVVGMRIPATREAPHFARGTDDSVLRCPRRDGAHTVFMPERDIERAYRARFDRRTEWQQRFEELQADAFALTDFSECVGALAVAAPREDPPLIARAQNDATTVLIEARENPLYQETSRYPCLPYPRDPRPGYRSVRFVDNFRGITEAACTLYQSGAVSLTMRLGTLGLHDADPDTAASQWVFKSVADFITLVVAHARTVGHSDTYGAVYEMRGPNPFYLEVGTSHGFRLQRRGELPPVRRFVPVPFEIDPQATDNELLELAKITALDVVNQGGISDLGLSALLTR